MNGQKERKLLVATSVGYEKEPSQILNAVAINS